MKKKSKPKSYSQPPGVAVGGLPGLLGTQPQPWIPAVVGIPGNPFDNPHDALKQKQKEFEKYIEQYHQMMGNPVVDKPKRQCVKGRTQYPSTDNNNYIYCYLGHKETVHYHLPDSYNINNFQAWNAGDTFHICYTHCGTNYAAKFHISEFKVLEHDTDPCYLFVDYDKHYEIKRIDHLDFEIIDGKEFVKLTRNPQVREAA